MRSDFEILGYNIVLWLCGSLPWKDILNNKLAVQKQKEKAFKNIDGFLNECFGDDVPGPISEYMKLLADVKFNEAPDYDKFRKIIVKGLEDLGSSPSGKLEFSVSTGTVSKTASTPRKTKKVVETASASRKSPRIKAPKSPNPSRSTGPSLDDSNVGIVVDRKREGLKGMRQILETMEDDSDAEYDICITKKRKVKKIAEKTATKSATPRKGRKKAAIVEKLDSSAASEPEVRIFASV